MEATKQGVIDVYPEYNGTGLIFLGQAPTSDGEASTETVQRLFNPLGMEMTGKFGFSNDYAIVMTRERSQELDVDAIGDLAGLGMTLTFAVDDDFTKRPADGLPQLLRRYGITQSATQHSRWGRRARTRSSPRCSTDRPTLPSSSSPTARSRSTTSSSWRTI